MGLWLQQVNSRLIILRPWVRILFKLDLFLFFLPFSLISRMSKVKSLQGVLLKTYLKMETQLCCLVQSRLIKERLGLKSRKFLSQLRILQMCCLQRNFIARAPAVHEIPKGRFRSDSASAALSGFKILQQVQNLSFSIFFLSFFLSIFSLGLGVKSKGLLHHQNTTFSQKREKPCSFKELEQAWAQRPGLHLHTL